MDDNFRLGHYNVSNFTSYVFQVCYMKNVTKAHVSYWVAENLLINHLPFLAMQLGLVIFISHVLTFLIRPLFQTRILAEILAGIIIGPSGFGALTFFIMPFETNLVIETFADMGLTYYMFLVGLEMDLSIVRHIDKKSLSISIFGIVIPIGVGLGLYFLPMSQIPLELNPFGAAFWAITLTSTSFPDLARILSDVKLLHTDLGRLALNVAFISDISTWVLLVIAVIMLNDHKFYMMIPLTMGFLGIFWFVIRPSIIRMIKDKKRERGKFGETHVYLVLIGVAICGLVTDAFGSHSMIGGFMLGLIIPNGELGFTIMEKIEEFVSGIMLPLFLVVSGLRTNLYLLIFKTNWGLVALVIILATIAKIASTLMVSLYLRMPAQDGLALGSLMNTKGILALIVINESRNLQITDNVTTTVLIFTVLFMTILVGPILFITNKSTRNSRQYKNRTLQRSNPNTEFRILTCIHSIGNLSGTIKLLQVSNPTHKSPIYVFVAHLVELTGRAAAMLIVHDKPQRTNNTTSKSHTSREKLESDQIINAFEHYAFCHDAVYVDPLTIVSPYTTMHQDIFNLAEDKRATMILIPFQKQPMVGDRVIQDQQDSVREVNLNLLAKLPCSVGLLVDRGLGSSTCPSELRFAMLFIGGPDDREALSYAWRMAGSPFVTLTVIRFLASKDDNKTDDGNTTENELDDEYIDEFRFKAMCDESITYLEKQVNNGAELLEYVDTKQNEFDLYIVGRSQGQKSPIMVGLSDWNDFVELGPVGEALVLSEFTSNSSVLVVQQYSSSGNSRVKSLKHNSKFEQRKWASPIVNPNYEAFLNDESDR